MVTGSAAFGLRMVYRLRESSNQPDGALFYKAGWTTAEQKRRWLGSQALRFRR